MSGLVSPARFMAGTMLGLLFAPPGVAPARAAEAPAASAAAPLLIEAYGDSTTLGITCLNGHCAPHTPNAVSDLADALRACWATRVEVANLGVGWSMASQLLDGTDRPHGVPWRARMRASSARIVTLNYGINEVMLHESPEQFYAAETALVRIAREAGKEPVLETSNPLPDARLDAQLARMVAMTRRVAAEQHVPLVDQYAAISALPDWRAMMSDGAHPRPPLYRFKAGEDWRALRPLVARQLGANPNTNPNADAAACAPTATAPGGPRFPIATTEGNP